MVSRQWFIPVPSEARHATRRQSPLGCGHHDATAACGTEGLVCSHNRGKPGRLAAGVIGELLNFSFHQNSRRNIQVLPECCEPRACQSRTRLPAGSGVSPQAEPFEAVVQRPAAAISVQLYN